MMKIKAAQIARDLGLSKATVSLALNDKPGVSDQMRLLILRTADEMGYSGQKVLPPPALPGLQSQGCRTAFRVSSSERLQDA